MAKLPQPFTDAQLKALKLLEKAFSECHRLKIEIVGMDDNLYASTSEARKYVEETMLKKANMGDGHYHPVAYAQNMEELSGQCTAKIKANAFKESGAW